MTAASWFVVLTVAALLALALFWPRRGLLERLAKTMAQMYGDRVTSNTVKERMASVRALFAERGVAFSIDEQSELPILIAETCPYPDLAEKDRGICSLEKMLLSELLDENVSLTGCRLDGATCCTFETH